MISIVTSNNPALFRQLAAKGFKRAGTQCRVVRSGPEALAAIAAEPPALAVLDVALPELDGYEVCRRIKADRELAEVCVILAHSGLLGRAGRSLVAASACDDLMCLPAPAEELYQHAAHLLGLVGRTHGRVSVDLGVKVRGGARAVEGRLLNLSLDGAKIGFAEPVGKPREIEVRFERGGEASAVAVRAKVVWVREAEEGFGAVVGAKFLDPSPKVQRLLAALVLWEPSVDEDGTELVTLQGELGEHTDLSELARHLESRSSVEIDLSGVSHINSWGVRLWVDFVNGLPPSLTYSFVRVSIPMVMQMGMISRALGRGTVLSLFAPYACGRCEHAEERILQCACLGPPPGEPPRFRCARCGGELAFDDVAERYFSFLE